MTLRLTCRPKQISPKSLRRGEEVAVVGERQHTNAADHGDYTDDWGKRDALLVVGARK